MVLIGVNYKGKSNMKHVLLASLLSAVVFASEPDQNPAEPQISNDANQDDHQSPEDKRRAEILELHDFIYGFPN